MAWFTKDFNSFLKELAANNNKEWFDANRERYERSVREPFKAFVAAMIKHVAKLDPSVRIEAKDAIFRINRDIRFSKDKTPYKTSVSAIVSSGGRKGMDTPGIYFELGPEAVRIYGGRYMPDKDGLTELRERIAAEPAKFKKLYSERKFSSRFGGVEGEKNKVLPKEFQSAAVKEPLLFNKQFYYKADLPASAVLDPKLDKVLMDHYIAMRPMNEFLAAKV